jgi:hypothetical protein
MFSMSICLESDEKNTKGVYLVNWILESKLHCDKSYS